VEHTGNIVSYPNRCSQILEFTVKQTVAGRADGFIDLADLDPPGFLPDVPDDSAFLFDAAHISKVYTVYLVIVGQKRRITKKELSNANRDEKEEG